MKDDNLKAVCLSLLHADTQEEVVSILSYAGFWQEPGAWRYYGDREDNFSTIGNQQSAPEAALVEKLVNSIDAVLMGECWASGVSPEDPAAPATIYEAVARYFYGDATKAETLGHISYWPDEKRKAVSQRITVAATGSRQSPCFTIADSGEGQTPKSMPETLLSLDKKNKLRVPFVQGKFNMGGTGALQFCGLHNLQLVISHRDPRAFASIQSDPSQDTWGFTVIRRENPEGGRRTSVYTYLAPTGSDTKHRKGDVLRFAAATLPIFPRGQMAYAQEAKWGTAIKLYEYNASGFRTHMFLRDGLLSRLDILLSEAALPVRLYECRDYPGHAGSFETTLSGLSVRLEDDKAKNLEEGFPTTSPMVVEAEPMTARIYAFKKGKVDTYRKNEAIIFTVNGQTHAHLTTSFLGRKSVGMGRLDDSVIVSVDCSNLSGRAREDLFMNSRDRLRNGELRNAIERELEIMIRDHPGLRELRERRRREDIEAKLKDSRPMRDVLQSILRTSPSLAALFSTGKVLPNPFKTNPVVTSQGPFPGKPHPTYFKLKRVAYGEELHRECAINLRCRVAFETDVVNDYFDRRENKGTFLLRAAKDSSALEVSTYSLNLQNGLANLTVSLPQGCTVGDNIRYVAIVTDPTLIEPFVNAFAVVVGPAQQTHKGGKGKATGPPGPVKGKERESPAGMSMPEIHEVGMLNWDKHKFDKYSALKVVQEEAEDTETLADDRDPPFSYYVNVDNVYLKTEMKSSKDDPDILKARWVFGLVLIGMALLRADSEIHLLDPDNQEASVGNNELSLSERVSRISTAIAPVLLPLIESLGAIGEEQIAEAAQPET